MRPGTQRGPADAAATHARAGETLGDGALADGDTRSRITEALDETLFVEAGAGSGKTRCLVDRVVATVLDGGVPMRNVAAVTFTEKAGAELRDRLREAFETTVRDGDDPTNPDPARRDAAAAALDELDGAAIGTLHSFAQRILTEHPIEAGLPPLIEVLDEVSSGVAFDERWAEESRELLDSDALAEPLLLGLATGIKPEHLRSLAKTFTSDWDLLTERVLAQPEPTLPPVEAADTLASEARRLASMSVYCREEDDGLLIKLPDLAAWAEQLAHAPDDAARVGLLKGVPRMGNAGNKGSWECDLAQIKRDCRDLVKRAGAVVQQVQDAVLRLLARWVAEKTLEAAEERRAEGRLEFHDLLVLARDLLRRDAGVRETLSQRYQRLLLDEFQDTDPIQIELAVRIAGGAAASAPRWEDVAVPPGRIFVVGDPKQSIYRFRRADIATYLQARQHVGSPLALTTNFRTTEPILAWVNAVFSRLIQPEPGSQPEYRPLDAYRPAADVGPPVVTLGSAAHQQRLTADTLREREAADIAAVIRQALAEGWQVYDQRSGRWRRVQPHDVAVLVPARTSLPQLEDALDASGIPYRAEASSLVYQSPEVRDLLVAARAIDDPSDAFALVTALRSGLFGCGDDDLWTWRQAGGQFNILSPPPEVAGGAHPVAEAIAYLRALHNRARWLSPGEILSALVTDRRMLEVAALAGGRPRDSWRRLRFAVDQARAWSEAEHGGLRAYLAWAARQAQESTRAAEAVLPETDTDAVRVMTVHAAKGFEFPFVILSGLTSQPRAARGVRVLWPPEGGYAVKLGSGIQTGDFEAAQPLDEQMDQHERLRLLYVASTRARDHLAVSLHRSAESSTRTNSSLLAEAAGAEQAVTFDPGAAGAAAMPMLARSRPGPPPDWPGWSARISQTRERAKRPSAISASGLEGTEPAAAEADPGLAKGPRDLELPPWSKGRFGTAIGRAVHGVLQTTDLTTGDGLADAVTAQTLAEGVVDHADIVRDLADSALRSEIVRTAAGRPHWRETYVGTVLDDGTVLEGFIDLIYRDLDRLTVVDYKTDAVPAAAIDARVAFYRPQMGGYVQAVEAATGEKVTHAALLFLTPQLAIERRLERNHLDRRPTEESRT